MSENLVVSKQRVADHGEVYTSAREVNAMLDMVAQEMERIESRVLEPACGNGNFLAEVLSRKLEVISRRYAHSQFEFERYAILAICSLYGIDILEDNVESCRDRLLNLLIDHCRQKFGPSVNVNLLRSAEYVLSKNIVWGDALTLKTVAESSHPIIFSEWSPVNGTMIKRRDFLFHGLLSHQETAALPLFSDLGEDVFLPEPVNEFPPMNFLRLADAG
ncbi:MAG: SAM-dependent DNA methyltransferase [Fluviibacter sp.]